MLFLDVNKPFNNICVCCVQSPAHHTPNMCVAKSPLLQLQKMPQCLPLYPAVHTTTIPLRWIEYLPNLPRTVWVLLFPGYVHIISSVVGTLNRGSLNGRRAVTVTKWVSLLCSFALFRCSHEQIKFSKLLSVKQNSLLFLNVYYLLKNSFGSCVVRTYFKTEYKKYTFLRTLISD